MLADGACGRNSTSQNKHVAVLSTSKCCGSCIPLSGGLQAREKSSTQTRVSRTLMEAFMPRTCYLHSPKHCNSYK